MASGYDGEFSLLEFCRECKDNCCTWGGPIVTREECDAIVDAGYRPRFVKMGELYRIESNGSGACIYFKNRLCSIENAKPSGCKTFPLAKYRHDETGEIRIGVCVRCPATDKLPTGFVSAALDELRKVGDEQAVAWTDRNKYPKRPF